MASIFATYETFTVTKDYLDFLNVLHTKIKKELFTESSKNVLLWPRCEIPLLESLRIFGILRLILKQPDAGAVCTGNDRLEGPVGTAIVSRLSALLLTRVRGHAALHHGISDHTADRQRSTDSIRFQIKTGTSKSTEGTNREWRPRKKLWCKAQFRAQNALTFLLVTIFTNYQNVHYIHFKWSKFSHPKHTVKY